MPHRSVTLGSTIFLILISVLAFDSCRHKDKPKHFKAAKAKKAKPSKVTRDSFESHRDSLFLFDLDLTEGTKGDTVGFVSVSQLDALPGNLDSPEDSVTKLVIPDLTGKTAEETRYLTLKSKYRKRMFTGTGISEKDSLFVYDYANDVLLTFPVSSLKVVASLSPYEDETEVLHQARDYQIGFEINRKLLNGLTDHYFANTYVFIGTKNPFLRGQMHPIIWKKINPQDIPVVSLDKESKSILKTYKFTGAFSFELNNFHYYLQRYANSDEQSPALRLVVTNPTKEVVFNQVYSESDGESPSPISIADSSKYRPEQWTGHLFKNKPPLILGFEDLDFGCPILPYLDKSGNFVDFLCDNRH
jgi:hypothetical protein